MGQQVAVSVMDETAGAAQFSLMWGGEGKRKRKQKARPWEPGWESQCVQHVKASASCARAEKPFQPLPNYAAAGAAVSLAPPPSCSSGLTHTPLAGESVRPWRSSKGSCPGSSSNVKRWKSRTSAILASCDVYRCVCVF